MSTTLRDEEWYLELPDWREDGRLIDAVASCIEPQRRSAEDRVRRTFTPDTTGGRVVSEERLRDVLEEGRDIHGISTEGDISNVVPFNARSIGGAVMSREVAASRRQVDRLVAAKIRRSLGRSLLVHNSGHFWYPPGGYMGWHTNSGAPGWRLYLTHSEEPGRSFFRYRDPVTGEIHTSYDQAWDARLFRISRETLLWHAVYSDTNRFSLGFIIRPWSVAGFVSSKLTGIRQKLGG